MTSIKSGTKTSELLQLSANSVKDLDGCLEFVIKNSDANYAIAVDKTGAVLSSSGTFATAEPEVIAAIMAATYAALKSLVEITEANELSIKFYGKKSKNIYLSTVNERTYLVVVYGNKAYASKIRTVARPVVRKMQELLSNRSSGETALQTFSFIQEKINDVFKTK